MRGQTDTEIIQHFELYTMEVARLLNSGEDFKSIASAIPFPVHMNDAHTLELAGVNNAHITQMGCHFDEIREMGLKFMETRVHPDSLATLPHFIASYQKESDVKRARPFLQYVKLYNKDDYDPIITFSAPVNVNRKVMLCLSPEIKDLKLATEKLRKIFAIDQFKVKHFQRFKQLSAREAGVLKLLCLGHDNPAIADLLFVSRATVETHRKRIKSKLATSSFSDLMRYAVAFDLIIV